MENKKIKSFIIFGSLGLLLIFLIITWAIYIPNLKNKTLGFSNNYSFLNPGAALIQKSNLIVNFQPLRDSLIQKYSQTGDYLVSLYFEYLPTGSNITINKDEKIWPASLIKIPVAMAAMKKVQDETWQFDNKLVILDEDKDSEFGDLYLQSTGTTIAIRDLFYESLVNSDNTAHFVLLRNLDGSELEDVFSHIGLDEVLETLKKSPKGEEADNRMTAKNYSIFFRSLYNATYLDPEYSNIFLEILKDAPSEYLDAGIPENIAFAHKTGIRVDEKVWADSGIIYLPGRPYLLTVMIQQQKNAAIDRLGAESIFKDISQEIYQYVSTAQ